MAVATKMFKKERLYRAFFYSCGCAQKLGLNLIRYTKDVELSRRTLMCFLSARLRANRISFTLKFHKGLFTNYVDKILAFF